MLLRVGVCWCVWVHVIVLVGVCQCMAFWMVCCSVLVHVILFSVLVHVGVSIHVILMGMLVHVDVCPCFGWCVGCVGVCWCVLVGSSFPNLETA